MLQRGALIPRALLRRSLSTPRHTKGLNLTSYVSPLLLRLHPDMVQRHAPALAQENEQALKMLNVFLELATCGCNNDVRNARNLVLALRDQYEAVVEASVVFPLVFHAPIDNYETQEQVPEFIRVKYTIEIPYRLVRRTLSHHGRSISTRYDPKAALQAPFAREWQRTTKRILQDLFDVAQVPLVAEERGKKTMTALADWLAEEDTVVDQAERHGIRAVEHNRAVKREHEEFNNLYHAMLMREKNIVHEVTTGLEDGPTRQHAVLTSLLHSRLFLPKFRDPHMKKSAFHWIANLMLVNFMELRLHNLVWNKVTLLVTADSGIDEPQVSWDEEAPEQGMGFLIPIGMDVDTLIDFMFENVEDLEFALVQKSYCKQAAASAEHKLRRELKTKQKGRSRRRDHFYKAEVDQIFSRR